jgi:hypothetical protein
MGNLKVGDDIIVTKVLSKVSAAIKAKSIIGTKHKIIRIDFIDFIGFEFQTYPYQILINGSTFWVEGIPYSSLMMELV